MNIDFFLNKEIISFYQTVFIIKGISKNIYFWYEMLLNIMKIKI